MPLPDKYKNEEDFANDENFGAAVPTGSKMMINNIQDRDLCN